MLNVLVASDTSSIVSNKPSNVCDLSFKSSSNVLTFPIIGMLIYYEYLAIKDMIRKENKLFETYFGFIINHIVLFAGLIIVSMVYENICQI